MNTATLKNLLHNSKVKSMQESIIESDRRNTDAQNTANQLLNQTQ